MTKVKVNKCFNDLNFKYIQILKAYFKSPPDFINYTRKRLETSHSETDQIDQQIPNLFPARS